MQKENRIQTARRLYLDGQFKKALAIIVTFRIGFTKDDIRSMEIAYESLIGKRDLYEKLEIDIEDHIQKCKELFETKILSK